MDNKELKQEVEKYADEAESLAEDECYHSANLSIKELMTPSVDRPYYILLQKKDEYQKEDLYIYVDRHDYLVYKRPIWREWRNEQNAKRCIIIENGVRKRCMKDCSICQQFKNGKPASLDKIQEEKNYEFESDEASGADLVFYKEAINMLWAIIRKHATLEQYDKIVKHYKDGLTLEQIGSEYGVTKQAAGKAELKFFRSLAQFISDEDKQFLYGQIINKNR